MVGYHTPRIFLPFAISTVIAFGTPRAKQTNVVPARCAATERRRQDYPAQTFKPNVLYFPFRQTTPHRSAIMPTTTSPLTPATHGLRVAASFNLESRVY
jgi:hypothetical protein